jgi:excisionase family DNA binding protein
VKLRAVTEAEDNLLDYFSAVLMVAIDEVIDSWNALELEERLRLRVVQEELREVDPLVQVGALQSLIEIAADHGVDGRPVRILPTSPVVTAPSAISESTDLIGPNELSVELGIPLGTIYQWNHRGVGPRFIKVGKHVRYRRSDIDEWMNRRAVPGG